MRVPPAAPRPAPPVGALALAAAAGVVEIAVRYSLFDDFHVHSGLTLAASALCIGCVVVLTAGLMTRYRLPPVLCVLFYYLAMVVATFLGMICTLDPLTPVRWELACNVSWVGAPFLVAFTGPVVVAWVAAGRLLGRAGSLRARAVYGWPMHVCALMMSILQSGFPPGYDSQFHRIVGLVVFGVWAGALAVYDAVLLARLIRARHAIEPAVTGGRIVLDSGVGDGLWAFVVPDGLSASSASYRRLPEAGTLALVRGDRRAGVRVMVPLLAIAGLVLALHVTLVIWAFATP